MKTKKTILLLSLMTCLSATPILASESNTTHENYIQEHNQEVPIIIFGDGTGSILQDGREIASPIARGITAEGDISISSASGGRANISYNHYGANRYDGRAYFNNMGTRSIEVETYTATGYKVHSFTLAPGKDATCYFTQSVLRWELADGWGNFHFHTADGGDGRIAYRYNVLD